MVANKDILTFIWPQHNLGKTPLGEITHTSHQDISTTTSQSGYVLGVTLPEAARLEEFRIQPLPPWDNQHLSSRIVLRVSGVPLVIHNISVNDTGGAAGTNRLDIKLFDIGGLIGLFVGRGDKIWVEWTGSGVDPTDLTSFQFQLWGRWIRSP